MTPFLCHFWPCGVIPETWLNHWDCFFIFFGIFWQFLANFFVNIVSILCYFYPYLSIYFEGDITCRPPRACRPRQRRRAASSWWGGCPRSPSRGGPGCCTSRHTAASRTGHTANYHSCLLQYNFMPCRSSQTHGKLLWHIVMQHWSNVPHQCTDCILYWRSKLAMISTQTIMPVSNLVFLVQKYCCVSSGCRTMSAK